jgi:Tol biopolymer transport system component
MQIVFDSSRKGKRDLYIISATGHPGSEAELLVTPQNKTHVSWSPNGRFVFYATDNPQTGSDVWVLRMSDKKTWPLLNARYNEISPQLSPDGHLLAYVSTESDHAEVFVRRFDASMMDATTVSPTSTESGDQWQMQISTAGGNQPCWDPTGKRLYYVALPPSTACELARESPF